MLSRVSRRACMLAATTVLALVVITPAAQAGLFDLSGADCANQQFTQPFASWLDQNSYFLVRGGDFEPGGAAWNTTGNANVVFGNEPWRVHESNDHASLSLSPGSSATSPAVCVTPTSPTLRFFARGAGGLPGDSLKVEVLFQTTAGVINALPIGSVSVSGNWSPTPIYLLAANLLSAAGALQVPGTDYTAIAFRFAPQGDATWQIDDVYVDPWRKG